MHTNLVWRIRTGVALIAVLLLCAPLLGRRSLECKEDFIVVSGDLSPKLMQVISDNAKACFGSLNKTYFQFEPNEPLKVYVSQTVADARKLIEDHGRLIEAGDRLYVPSVPAVYTYIYTGNDKSITFEPLYASIAEYFISQRLSGAKEWFRLGLISFLSEGAHISNGEHVPGDICPRTGLALRAEVDAQTRLNIKRLYGYGSSDEGYRKWSTGRHLAAALLCWLHQNGHLANYVRNVQRKGYDLDVLEETVGSSSGRINVDLKKFIEGDFCTAAYLAEAENAQDNDKKEQALQAALQEKPDYARAQLALARLYYSTGKNRLCRKTLMPILVRAKDAELMPAAKLVAKSYYDDKNYDLAREYYEKAWEYAEYYAYRYQIAYETANCCHYLDKPEEAAQWYQRFLDLNFRPVENEAAVKYAQKYVETFGPEKPPKTKH